jgi:hypothetical protein
MTPEQLMVCDREAVRLMVKKNPQLRGEGK